MNCIYDGSVLCPYTVEVLMNDPDLCCYCEEDLEK